MQKYACKKHACLLPAHLVVWQDVRQGKKVFGDPVDLGRAERSELERTFLDWLAVGGFPEVQGLEPGTRRQFLQGSVTYVRTQDGHEADFLARGPGGEQELIQVCSDASEPATANRELRALMAAGEMYPSARQRLLTLARDSAPSEVPPGVVVQPACEWMLTS